MARTRESFGSHENLAHIWASQSYPRGHSSDRRMSFEGETIYSFGRHFPMAMLFTGRDGLEYSLQNSDGYSTTTAKHKGIMRRAVTHKRGVLDLPTDLMNQMERLASFFGPDLRKWEGDALAGLKSLWGDAVTVAKKRIVESSLKAKRARKNADWYLREVDSTIGELESLRAAWKMPVIKSLDIAALVKETEAARVEAAAKEKERKARLARQHAQARAEIVALPDAWRVHGPAPLFKKVEGGEGKPMSINHWHDLGGHTLLRRSLDGATVETSRGANVPWNEALKLYTFARRVQGKGEPWTPPPDVKCGPYRLTAIDESGNVRIGCHDLLMVEMQALAVREGVAI